MRELVKKEQLVTIVPQDFKNSNRGKVLEVSQEGFSMALQYKPVGLVENHICEFYSMTDNGYLYFESYIQGVEDNIIKIANPVKHRFLQRRKYTRIKFIEDIELVFENQTFKAHTLDLSAGGMKIQTMENLDIEKEYRIVIRLSNEQEIKCKYQLIRVERGDDGKYTISGRFTQLTNIDKMVLVQYCLQKEMENQNK